MRTPILALLTALAFTAAACSDPVAPRGATPDVLPRLSLTASGADKITICHAAGRAGTTHFVELTLSAAAYSAHFDESGTPQAGHELDRMGPCNPPGGALVICKRPDATITDVPAYFGSTVFTFTVNGQSHPLTVNTCTNRIALAAGDYTVTELFQYAEPGRGVWWASSVTTDPTSALVSVSNPIGSDAVAVVTVSAGQTTTVSFFNIDP